MAEHDCGVVHLRIEDAIRCARVSLGVDLRVYPPIDAKPYQGEMDYNAMYVVGRMIDKKRRWRLDWHKEKGIHVNEENFAPQAAHQKIIHKVRNPALGEETVYLFWNKWTSGANPYRPTGPNYRWVP